MQGKLLLDPLALCLVRAGILGQGEAMQAVLAAQGAKLSLVAYLAQHRQVDCGVMAEQLAEYLGLQRFDLNRLTVDAVVTGVVDEEFIRLQRVLPLYVEAGELYVAIAEPGQLEVLGEIKFHTDMNVVPLVVEWDKLARLIEACLSERQYQALSHFQPVNSGLADNDERIMQMVQEILLDAVKKGVSDIHLEPYKTSYRIRQRIDGILHKVTQLSPDLAVRMTARLKILARLDIAERRLPQDGRFSIEINAQEVRDCRISTCPTLFGEKTVVRILDGGKIILNVDDLGMEAVQKNLFVQAIHKPQGMLLVTGPTGSGKTVTLYTALSLLNTLDKNISTVEEPVEVQLPGVNQVNINVKADLTFSKVLRAFLRQDPDILMVGEIRDRETADIAMKAAQTGHFVLSTLHANSAPETISRLLMMGISAFNIVHSIHMIIAQRLVRKLCVHCRREKDTSMEILLAAGFEKQDILQLTSLQKGSIAVDECVQISSTQTSIVPNPPLKLYEAVGCEYCIKGYNGRIGIFEILNMTSAIANIIMHQGTSSEIAAEAKHENMINLRAAALRQLLSGITSLEEVQRVIL
ncbi:MAG TPA: ATPase, T2SS/T4P/T4SS family [Gammaproteobacteria bacterium]|nr:ATPase, T2SS/T4P/T4SS family [Gammaproteobacteria bacterium]